RDQSAYAVFNHISLLHQASQIFLAHQLVTLAIRQLHRRRCVNRFSGFIFTVATSFIKLLQGEAKGIESSMAVRTRTCGVVKLVLLARSFSCLDSFCLGERWNDVRGGGPID